MSKTLRNIIIAVVVIILLIVGIVIINNIDTTNENVQSEESIFTIFAENTDDIAEVLVDNGTETIKAVNLDDSSWTINDINVNEVDSAKVCALVSAVATLSSKNKVEETPTDLVQYGLENPQITVTMTKKNGEINKMYVGDKSPTIGEYFVMKDGDNTVYTMYDFKFNTLKQPVSYYQEFNRFNINIDNISDIKIIRSDETIEIKLVDNINKNTNNVWEMVSPYQSGANDDYIDNKILTPIEEINLDVPLDGIESAFSDSSPILILYVKPYDNSTGKYGDVYTETLTIGRTDGDKTYVKYKDEIFATSTESISFVNDSSYNIVSKLQALVDISEVKSVTLEYNELQNVIDINQDDSGISFKLNGNDVDSQITQTIYQNIIGLAVDGVYNKEPMGETVFKIKYTGIKSESDTEIEFCEIDDLNCVLVRNGKAEFTIKKSKLMDFIEVIDSYVQTSNE